MSKPTVWKAILCVCSIFCHSRPGSGQTPGPAGPTNTPHLAFDVVSIHESREGNTSYFDNMPKNSYFHGERVSVWGLILGAYDLHLFNLVENVPNWAMTTKFDVTAKSDHETDEALAKLSDSDSYAEKRLMLQQLLAERFKLKIHPETRVSRTYELVATARAAKLMTPVQGDVAKTVSTCNQHYSTKGIEVVSKGCPFTIFLSNLQQQLGTKVLDHTGFSGAYAYDLMWNPRPLTSQDDEERYPQIEDAIREQLGLELKATKGPVTFWVVDHIERPTAN